MKTTNSIRLFLIFAVLPTMPALGFSLLGPFADWMDVEKGYRFTGEIGGPMNINEGYRWNIPVVTYGFDRSFLDYFGSNGVAAVEQAIAMLNDVPPASTINLDDYPLRTLQRDWRAKSFALMDLKSYTAGLLLSEMGLADPLRFTFCIRDFLEVRPSEFDFSVIMRNFDADTAIPSHYVNGVLLSFDIPHAPEPIPGQFFCDAQEFPVDFLVTYYESVASLATIGQMSPYGLYIRNLTRDDVGALRFLLGANEIRAESLPEDVHLVDTNSGSLVVTADRPGIEKISFVQHPFGTLNGRFLPFTNRWTDIYYDFFFPVFQDVERVTSAPDILFRARDLGPWLPWERTGTTNWANNASLNGNTGGSGPGVINGPTIITYNTVGPFYYAPGLTDTNAIPSELTSFIVSGWGSFSGTTNLPLAIYPVGRASFQPTQVHLRLLLSSGTKEMQWPVSARAYQRCEFQTSTNLITWSPLATLTNSGTRFDYDFQPAPEEPLRFFRAVPLQ